MLKWFFVNALNEGRKPLLSRPPPKDLFETVDIDKLGLGETSIAEIALGWASIESTRLAGSDIDCEN